MTNLHLYDHPGSICSQMARLALVEKGLDFTRQTIDIMDTSEQFEPWYVALNPRAVVPTLRIGDEIVTDTVTIVNRVNGFNGPDLTIGDRDEIQNWLTRIMGLHYGVLLYAGRLEPDGTSPTMIARAKMLKDLRDNRPDLANLLNKRLDGNARLQTILQDPAKTREHIDSARVLVEEMNHALENSEFLCRTGYTLADCFATAALARYRIHGYDTWWSDGNNSNISAYYARVKARPSFAKASVVDTGTERDL